MPHRLSALLAMLLLPLTLGAVDVGGWDEVAQAAGLR